jgi:hypothetical protein
MAQLKFPAQQAALLVEMGAAPLTGAGNWLEHLPVPYLGYQMFSAYWMAVGSRVTGLSVGILVGLLVGVSVGVLVDGDAVGVLVDGDAVGLNVGALDGDDVGLSVGVLDGDDVVGALVGLSVVGDPVGLSVGAIDGDAVGGLTKFWMQYWDVCPAYAALQHSSWES